MHGVVDNYVSGMADQRIIVTVAAIKGGVGKTTVVALLARAAAAAGHTVLAVDADPQGSLASWADLAGGLGAGVTVLAAPTAHFARELGKAAVGFTVVLIDCPPGDVRATAVAMSVSDLVLVPLAPTLADLDRLAPTLDLAQAAGCAAAIVLNRVRAGTRSTRLAAAALADGGWPVLATVVPLAERIAASYGSRSGTVAPFAALWSEVETLALTLKES